MARRGRDPSDDMDIAAEPSIPAVPSKKKQVMAEGGRARARLDRPRSKHTRASGGRATGEVIPGAPRDFAEYDNRQRARMRGPGYGDTLDIINEHKNAEPDEDSDDRRARGGKTPEFKPGGKKGKLHRELGIPEGEKIPTARLSSAAHSSSPEIRRDAIRAQTIKKWRHTGPKGD